MNTTMRTSILLLVLAVVGPWSHGDAVVSTVLLDGDPSQPGEYRIGIAVSSIEDATIGTMAFLVRCPADAALATFESALPSVFSYSFPSPGAMIVSSGEVQYRDLVEGFYVVITFQRTMEAAASFDITLHPYGRNPVVDSEGRQIRFTIDTSGTRGLGSGPYVPLGPLVRDTRVPETEIDGDLVPSRHEAFFPEPNQSNWSLPDSDGDGLLDHEEDLNRNGYYNPGETFARRADSDGDGVGDGVEVLLLGSEPLNPSDPAVVMDADEDGLPASLDPDDTNPDVDGDRFMDGFEAVHGGLAAVTDPDLVPPHFVTHRYAPSFHFAIFSRHASNENEGGGGFDARYMDDNLDGFIDAADTTGILRYVRHGGLRPSRLVEVPDADADGLPDDVETDPYVAGTGNRWLPDTDGDGLEDALEDASLDGMCDAHETDIANRDSDGDGIIDGVEVRLLGSDPLDPASPADPLMFVDADGDELPAGLDPDDNNPDSDGDRYSDGYEAVMHSLAAVEDAEIKPALGDINVDGHVTNLDALYIQAAFLRAIPLTHIPRISAADVNRDGDFTNLDALAVQGFFLNILERLPL